MNKMEWIAPCHFGLESVLKREIQDLGYEISQVEDGRVTFYGEADAACRANIFLRTAERVLLKVGSFKAVTFDELFEKTKALPRLLKSCFRGRKVFPGKSIFRRTESSGWRRRHRLRVSFSVPLIYSRS